MRPFNVKLICCIGLLLGIAVLIGCGTSDLLDENGQRYEVKSVTFNDAEEDGVVEIDVVQGECDDNLTIIDDNGTPGIDFDDTVMSDDPETFTNVTATITINIPENTPGLTLEGYRIEYFGEESADGSGGTLLPPDLADLLDHGTYSIDLPSGSTTTFTITCMTLDTKNEFLNASGWTLSSMGVDENGDGTFDYHVPLVFVNPPLVNRYTIRITMFFEDEFGEDREIQASRTIWLSNFDNC